MIFSLKTLIDSNFHHILLGNRVGIFEDKSKKTDNISVTQAVNLDTMESGIATNVTGINGILNHSIDGTFLNN